MIYSEKKITKLQTISFGAHLNFRLYTNYIIFSKVIFIINKQLKCIMELFIQNSYAYKIFAKNSFVYSE